MPADILKLSFGIVDYWCCWSVFGLLAVVGLGTDEGFIGFIGFGPGFGLDAIGFFLGICGCWGIIGGSEGG